MAVLKEKRDGSELGFRVFTGRDDTQYLVFKTLEGSFHVFFAEVEAKQAARECGATEEGNTRMMWESLLGAATIKSLMLSGLKCSSRARSCSDSSCGRIAKLRPEH